VVHDAVQGADIPVATLYPAGGPERTQRFGPYAIEAAEDAVPVDGRYPLVVLSHGASGSPWTLRDLAMHLVRQGFVAVLPEHVGNSRNDNGLAGSVANLQARPRHVGLAIDAARADPLIRGYLSPQPPALIGVSIGAYTALACAGGRPWAAPHETADGRPCPVDIVRPAAVGPLVLLAPATFWFIPEGSLKSVTAPILMFSGDRDEITPASCAALVRTGVARPEQVTHEVVPGAGHFSFLSLFPKDLDRPGFPPAHDPPGFDRRGFQGALFPAVTAFLKAHMAESGRVDR
jgi:predicted dienelactone hydrolase